MDKSLRKFWDFNPTNIIFYVDCKLTVWFLNKNLLPRPQVFYKESFRKRNLLNRLQNVSGWKRNVEKIVSLGNFDLFTAAKYRWRIRQEAQLLLNQCFDPSFLNGNRRKCEICSSIIKAFWKQLLCCRTGSDQGRNDKIIVSIWI